MTREEMDLIIEPMGAILKEKLKEQQDLIDTRISIINENWDDKVEEIKAHYEDQTKQLHEMVKDLTTQLEEIELKEGPAGKDGVDGVDGKDGESIKGEKGDGGEKGEKGEHGKDGLDGMFTKAVEYDGSPLDPLALVTFDGKLFQNLLEDNKSIPKSGNHSYQLLIDKPKDGKSMMPKGLYKEDAEYDVLDIVMINNSSFIKASPDATVCPGEGWFLLSKGTKGGRGDKGEKGDTGSQGPEGKPDPKLELKVAELEAKGIINEADSK